MLPLIVAAPLAASAAPPAQPQLGNRSAALISVDGLQFRDLDGSGDLTPYEDWRLSADARAEDLVSRMDPAQKAGTLVHGTLRSTATGYDTAAYSAELADRHVTTYISRYSADAGPLAESHNQLQEVAEAQPLGIPILISTDPRSGFSVTEGQTVSNRDFTAFPDPIGIGAVNDPATTEKMADLIRREYTAVGIREGLSPQADIATEPRWTRINGTFGSVGADVKQQVAAYVAGMQNGTDGLGSDSVATVVKHWVGYGAQDKGFDSHYYYGRYAVFPGNNFDEHIVPFTGAFESGASGVMPTYSILKDLQRDGSTIEQVGAGHNEYLLQNLLRGQYGFDGVITSDWGITGNCPQECQDRRPPQSFVGPWGVGTGWGTEDLTVPERYASTLNADVDIIGGTDDPAPILDALSQGLITQERIDAATTSVLKQKFELGLFENPYVDPAEAEAVLNDAASKQFALDVQQRSLTLLKNENRTLPVATGKTVYLSGVTADAATAAGLTPVSDLTQADYAIIRMTDPRGGADLTDLNFTGTEASYALLAQAHAAGVTTIAVPQLSRPLVLTNVLEQSDAVLASYGVSDQALMNVITGVASPAGTLPFELPSSNAEVAAPTQYSDVPNDTANPLFEYRSGLEYTSVNVTLSLTGVKRNGSIVLTGNAGNTDVTLTATTRLGDVRLGVLREDAGKTVSIDTHLPRIPAGSIKVKATAPDGTSTTYVVRYTGTR